MSDERPLNDADAIPGIESSPLLAARASDDEGTAVTEVLDADPAEDPAPTIDAPAEPAPASPLAATATASYAHACQIVAIALSDLAEYNQAVGSLTQVLPTASAVASSRSGRDGQTARISRPAPDEASVPDTDVSARTRHRIPRRAAIGLGLAAVVALAAALLLASGAPSLFSRVEVADVERTLAADPDFMDGFASDDYVDPSAYELADVSITQVEEDGEGLVRVDATASLRNDSFESDCLAVLLFSRASQVENHPEFEGASVPDGAEWVGVVVQATAETRAIAGVTRDADFPEGFSARFDAKAQSCTYEHLEAIDLWFGERTITTPYTYAFDGVAWTRSAGEAVDSFAFGASALDGSFSASEGDAVRMGAFEISSFNATSGAFTIEYRASTAGLAPQTISGVIDCTVEPAPATDDTASYRQADGYVYAFRGDGTSTGGEGTSHIEGYLGLDGSIVFAFSGDYTKPAFLFGDPSNETMEVSGIVSRRDA
ncbi:MAG: hypothetical protein SOU51_05025 [Collinsella sp.]|nr:hypothetical protein [Collinsella sp.]